MAKDRPKCITFKIVASTLGIISGVSIFIAFIPYRNPNAAVWGLLSGIFAAVNLRLHICYSKKKLHLKFTPESLRMVKLCGLCCSIGTAIASLTYFILVGVLKQGYKLEDDGYAPAGVFALLALKWTFMMYFSGRTYERFVRNYNIIEDGKITNEEPPPEYESVK